MVTHRAVSTNKPPRLSLDANRTNMPAGELEVLLGTSERASALLNSFRPVVKYSESTRKCPICLKKMEKILAGAEPAGLLIDKCSNGHGLWFDRNELADILAVGSFDDERKIQSLLAEIFGQSNRPAEDKNRNGKF